MTIPEDAVEVRARELWASVYDIPWAAASSTSKLTYLQQAREELEAVSA